MEPWLLDQLPRIVAGLISMVGLGAGTLFLKKSWNQFDRLYRADLIQAQKEIEGKDEIIEALNDRSVVREGRTTDLLSDVDRLKALALYWQQMAEQCMKNPPTPLPKPLPDTNETSSN